MKTKKYIRILSIILSLVLFCMCPMTASAETITQSDGTGAFTLTGSLYTSNGFMDIPDTASASSSVSGLVSGPYYVMSFYVSVVISDERPNSPYENLHWAMGQSGTLSLSTSTLSLVTAGNATSTHGMAVGMLSTDGNVYFADDVNFANSYSGYADYK